MKSTRSTLKACASIAGTVLAVVLLQVSLSLFYWLPPRSIAVAARPSIDAMGLIALILVASSLGQLGMTARRVLVGIVPLLLLLCVLLGIAQGVALREFGYHFALSYHTSKVVALFTMMYEAQGLLVFLTILSLLVCAVLLLVLGAAWALQRIIRIAQQGRKQQHILAGALVTYTVVAGFALGVNRSLIVEIGDQLDELVNREERLVQRASTIKQKMKTVRRLHLGEERRRPTVLIFVVESYGQILMEDDRYTDFREFLQLQEQKITRSGFHTRSTVLRSPVFGGSSWLASASILCRLFVDTEKTYESLMKTDTRCLPWQFNEAGYHSIFAGSNTTGISKEYSDRFPFETFLTRDSMGYAGPRMSWSYMPDQFVIDLVERKILSKESERPRFVYYKLSSSHHPWNTIPPYIARWADIGDGAIYKVTRGTYYLDNAFLAGEDYKRGYEDSIRYSLRTIVEYLAAMPEQRDVLAVVVGDHQPRRPVAIMDKAPWTVPLHVFSRDAALIDRFKRLGYRKGLFVHGKEHGIEHNAIPGLELMAEHIFRALNDVIEVETQVSE